MLHVLINDTPFKAIDFTEETIKDDYCEKELQKITFHFNVTSKTYHEVTTLLYKNDFHVHVPDRNLSFPATIANYSTSITNLYKENEVGTFYLELVEKC
ncbi:MAG TPA: DUF3219 family protein [Bacillota bacterium]|nr:DUF3219 family protein [Bacillota bacterium]